MRMSDLVGALVVDESGRPLGHVHDLRLVADGVTTVSDSHHVDRGYQDFAEQLHALGADVDREPDPDLFAPRHPCPR